MIMREYGGVNYFISILEEESGHVRRKKTFS